MGVGMGVGVGVGVNAGMSVGVSGDASGGRAGARVKRVRERERRFHVHFPRHRQETAVVCILQVKAMFSHSFVPLCSRSSFVNRFALL